MGYYINDCDFHHNEYDIPALIDQIKKHHRKVNPDFVGIPTFNYSVKGGKLIGQVVSQKKSMLLDIVNSYQDNTANFDMTDSEKLLAADRALNGIKEMLL